MNTSSSEIEDILQILQDVNNELSISELSRKSGVNRNKVAWITENLLKKGVVQCKQSSNAKKYSYLPFTATLTLIESIPDPTLILDDSLQIVRMNQAFLDLTKEGDDDYIGQRLTAVSHLFKGIDEGVISTVLFEKSEGYRASIPQDQSKTRYTCVRVALPDNHPGVLLSMKPVDAYNPAALYRKFVDRFFSKIRTITDEQQSEKVYDTITRMLRDIFPDDIVLSFFIDEQSRISSLNTISVPDSIRKPTRSEIELAVSLKTPVSFDEGDILPYKLYETVRIKGIPPMMLRSSDENLRIFSSLQSYEFLYVGITINDTLSGIIGIGKMDSGVSPDAYERILLAISRFFYLYETNRGRTDIHEGVVRKYKDEYRNIYNLLTEKTELDENRRIESDTLRSLIGIILDQMNVACFTLTPEGTITAANSTLLDLCSAEETDILKNPRLEDIAPTFLRDVIADLINSPEYQTEIGSYQVVVKASEQTQSSWCLIRSPKEDDLPYIFIGEKEPAPLIQYILMHEYRSCIHSSSRRVTV